MSADRTSPERDAPVRALSSLTSLSFAVQSAWDTVGLVTAVAEHVLELARADAFALLLLDYETGTLEGEVFERGRRGVAAHARVEPHPAGFLGRVLRRETLLIEREAGGVEAGFAWPEGADRTRIGVPILIGPSLLGVALLGYRVPATLTDRRRRALLFLADQIGLAVDRIRTHTELEAKSQALEAARASLRRIDEAKSDLISIVSHELRTPLTAIKAYTETLIDNAGDPTFTMQEKFLGIINEECDRLARMVNDVLDLSRMDSGRRRLRSEPVSLRRLLDDVLPTVEPGLRQKRLKLRLDLPADAPCLEADADLLKQVLVNLIHNAVKFSRLDGEIRVEASADGDRIRFAVEDHGPGIPADQRERIFDRFYRVEREGAERVAGTGLGLAIVRSVVDLHGGSVSVESEVGLGSRFVVELPREQQGFRALMRSLQPFFEQPDLRAMLQATAEMVAEVMDAGLVSLMFLTEEGSELAIQAAYGLDTDTVARTRVKIGDSIAGWVAQTSERLLVRDIEGDRRFRKMNHPQYETKSLLCVPLRVQGETVGVINVNNKRTGTPFDDDDLLLLAAVEKRIGAAIDRIRAAGQSPDVEGTIGSIRAITRARRTHLLSTSRRAVKLAAELGRRLDVTPESLEVLGYVARIHDVGMLSLGEGFLLSARRYTTEERREVEGHPQAGVQMLRGIELASLVNEIILGHHEHWDGSGYPRGLAREQIPLASRVLAVVDAFESMTMGRPYRDPLPEDEAVAELRRCSGTQFDPRVVDAFAALLAERAGAPEPARDPGPPPARPAGRPVETGWKRDAVR
ncbi:MAG TPA: HD domain-containing phosphohydrolase [Candidatus Eisenbacteria bacterium]